MIKKSYLLQAVVIMLVAVACNQEKQALQQQSKHSKTV